MSVVDEVKSRIDIVDYIGQQVTLQRAGRNFRANCPFHNERTPSFHVSPERQTWHCFGACGTGGDVFSFLMRRDGIEFPEALRILAERAGVQLQDRRDPAEDERHQRLYQANEAAAAFFHNALLNHKAAEHARAYLRSRGLDSQTIDAFQIGYSLDGWEVLKAHLTERGFTEAELLEAGLLVEGERGGYDRFRGRLMFPIRDERGRMAGFGGRQLDEDADPGAKYLNTSRSPIFDKGRLLYALDRAKEAIRRNGSVIVVEGYMDAIAAHQNGIANAVASMGTALTEAQIRLLERYRSKILLALDADAAGIEATLRALQEAEAAGVIRAGPASIHPAQLGDEAFAQQVQEWSRNALKRAAINFYVVPLSGKDPDEMIRNDRAAWDAALADPKPFTDHVFDLVAARKDRGQPAQRAELLQELLPVVRLIEEPAHRAHYIQRLARLAQVPDDDVRVELRKRPPSPRRATPVTTPVAVAPAQRAARQPGEEFCLAVLLQHSDMRVEGQALSPDVFLLADNRAVFDAWRETGDLDALRDALPEELHAHVQHLLTHSLPALEGAELRKAFENCVAKIEKDRLRQAMLVSAAALTDPETQSLLVPAVERAAALQRANGADSEPFMISGGDTQTSQLAVKLVEDEEMGRKLHYRPPSVQSTKRPEASPQDEDES